jgi:prolyl oligopeptidase
MLYGYGGFNVSLTPAFSIANAVWMENGGLCLPSLRGGGEYGKNGMMQELKCKKQNVFDDFIAAAEYLIAQNILPQIFLLLWWVKWRFASRCNHDTASRIDESRFAGSGSDGHVALPFTAGAGWAYDYGTAQDSKEMFEYIKGYSPVHNVKAGTHYPATMVTTGITMTE